MRDILEDLAAAQTIDPVALARGKMKADLPKRFYKAATAGPHGEGFAVLLDGKPVKTPARNWLQVPKLAQAEQLAAEWEAQETHINPATMPVTRLANSIIDGVARETEAVKDDIAKYAAGDLLLYRAEHPDSLVARQARAWDPVLDRMQQKLGVTFRLGYGVMPVAQDEAITPAVRAVLPDDAFVLGALHTLTTLYGSALLALHVLEGNEDVTSAYTLAVLDEDWNAEKWGADEEAIQRRAWRLAEVQAAAVFLG